MRQTRLTRARVLLAVFGILAGAFVVLQAPNLVQAEGTPDIELTKSMPSEVLYGEDVTATLSAFNPNSLGGQWGYNLSFRDVLPEGVTYIPGSTEPEDVEEPTVLLDQPAEGQTTLIWSNVADLAPQNTFEISYSFSYGTSVDPLNPCDDPLIFCVGSTIENDGWAFVNTNPRFVPDFDPITGVPVPAVTDPVDPESYTGWDSSSDETTLAPFVIEKDEGNAEGEILRGVHDHYTSYTVTVRNNDIAATDGFTVDDWLPAGLEFLGCGLADNTISAPTNPGFPEEYPGAPLLSATAPPSGSCFQPNLVETVETDPDGSGPMPFAVYTHVRWGAPAVPDLEPGDVFTMQYRAGIPIRENSLGWTGTEPTPASGQQASNLDNNSGAETSDEQALTNYARAEGTFHGPMTGGASNPVSDSTTLTRRAEDLSIHKSVSPPSIKQGEVVWWNLLAEVSEYRYVEDMVITDILPNGLCPLDEGVPFDPDDLSECNAAPGSGDSPNLPYSTLAPPLEKADGTWEITFDSSSGMQLAQTGPNGSFVITYPTQVRGFYQQNGLPTTPVVGRDGWSNEVDITGEAWVICAPAPSDGPICAPDATNQIDHERPNPQTVTDGSGAGQSASYASIGKWIGRPVGGLCDDSVSWSDSGAETLQFGPGDRICYRLSVQFPSQLHTRDAVVTDFIPPNTTFDTLTPVVELADHDVECEPKPPASCDDPDVDGPEITWELGTIEMDGNLYVGPGEVFDIAFAVIATDDPTANNNFDLVQNLMKFSALNTASSAVPLRSNVNYKLVMPVLDLTKSNDSLLPERQTDEVDYTVTVTNTGGLAAHEVEIWDLLPPQVGCEDVGSISDGGTCTEGPNPGGSAPGDGGRIEWTIPGPIAPLDDAPLNTYDVDYTLTVPDSSTFYDAGHTIPVPGAAAGDTFTNHAGIRQYESDTNIVGDPNAIYIPAENIDPSQDPDANAPAADDESSFSIRGTIISKGITSLTEQEGNNRNGSGADPYGTSAEATIGETLEFEVLHNISGMTSLYDAVLLDDLDPRLTYVPGSGEVTIPGEGTFSAGDLLPGGFTFPDSDPLTLTFPDEYRNDTFLTEQFVVTFQATVNDEPGITRSPLTGIPNMASVNYDNSLGEPLPTVASNNTIAQIVEPNVSVAKTNDKIGIPVQGGDTIHYTVTVTNNSGTRVSTANDLVIVDELPEGLTTSAPTGITPGGTYDAGPPQTITWTLVDLEPGDTATFEYDVEVDDAVIAGTPYVNDVDVSSTSMPTGDPQGTERTYTDDTSSEVNIVDPPVGKVVDPGTRTIGEDAEYTLTFTVPGNVVLNDMTVIDDMPDGLEFGGYNTCDDEGTNDLCPFLVGLGPELNSPTAGQTRLGGYFGDVGPLPSDTVITLTYTARVLPEYFDGADVVAGDVLTNSAALYWNTTDKIGPLNPGDPVPDPASYDVSTPDPPVEADLTVVEPQLSIGKQVMDMDGFYVDEASLDVAEPILYEITVTNSNAADSSPAYDIVIVDTVPAGLVVDELSISDGGVWDDGPRTITWTFAGPVAPGDTVTVDPLSYIADFPDSTTMSTGQEFVNTVDITEYWGVEDGSSDPARYREYDGPSDTATVTPAFPEPSVVKSHTGNATMGELFTWTIQMSNDSPIACLCDPSIVDELPQGWTYVPGSTQVTWGPDPVPGLHDPSDITGQFLTWDSTALGVPFLDPDNDDDPYTSLTLTFQAIPGWDARAGNADFAIVDNYVDVFGDDEQGNAGNAGGVYTDGDVDATGLEGADIGDLAYNDINGDGAWQPGEPGIPGVEVVLEWWDGDSWEQIGAAETTDSNGNYNFGLLMSGEYQVTVTSYDSTQWSPTAPNPPVWTGIVLDPGESYLDADFGFSAADLEITKDIGGPFYAGQVGTFTIDVHNYGPSNSIGTALEPIRVSDLVVPELAVTGASGTGWDCSATVGQAVDCSYVGSIAVGASAPPLTITVQIADDADLTSPYLNEAVVQPGETFDPDMSNNVDDVDVEVLPAADLTIAKSHTDEFIVGFEADYSITVTNLGPSPSIGTGGDPITVTDTLPLGLTPTAVDGGTDWDCDFDGPSRVVTCTFEGSLASGDSLDPIVVTVSVGVPAEGGVVNSAHVEPGPTHDPDPDNNDADDPTDITPAADLAIVKDIVAPFYAGQEGQYSLLVTNNGLSVSEATALDPIVVTDTLPTHLVPTAAGGGAWDCDISGQTVTCELGEDIAASTSADLIIITVEIPDNADLINGGWFLNSATVTPDLTLDPDLSNNTDDILIHVDPAADLEIVKEADPGDWLAGGTGTFTLTVNNLGPSSSLSPGGNRITVTDTFPAGLTPTGFSASAPWSCNIVGQTITCTLNSALGGGFAAPPITVTVAIAGTALGTITNTAVVAPGPTHDPNPTNNTDPADVVISPVSDLAITKTVDDDQILIDETATFTLTVTNNGPSINPGPITVVDTLPAGLDYVSLGATNIGLWTCDTSALPVISCVTAGPLGAGASLDGASAIEIVVTAPDGAPEGTPLVNEATVSSSTFDPNLSNNTDEASVTVTRSSDLEIVKLVDGQPSLAISSGDPAAFTLTVTNNGPNLNPGPITVVDELPTGLVFDSLVGTDPVWNCDTSVPSIISCVAAVALPVGADLPDIVVNVVAAGDAPEGTPLVNEATVSSPTFDPNLSNNTDEASVTVTHQADLTIDKSHMGDFTVGVPGTYTIVVSNIGPSPSVGTGGDPITMTDTLPAGLTPTGTNPGAGWTCDITDQTVECDFSGTIASGGQAPAIEITVAVGPSAAPVAINTASVAPGETDDPNLANNSDSDPTVIIPSADLVLTKAAPGNWLAGQPGTFTIDVFNAGLSDSVGTLGDPITVTDTLPIGLTPTAASGTGWDCDIDVPTRTVTCDLADDIEAGTSADLITINVQVANNADEINGGVFTNSATVVPGETFDPNTGNNTDDVEIQVLPAADLRIDKWASGSWYAGGEDTFYIEVVNDGPSPSIGTVASPITVTDTLPAELDPVSVFAMAPWSCDIDDQDVTCTMVGTLAANTSAPWIIITVDIADDADEAPSIVNTAEVEPGITTDPDMSNNEDSASVVVEPSADLTITKTVDEANLYSGETATFRIVVTNLGPSASVGSASEPITVIESLPGDFIGVTTDGGPEWDCDLFGFCYWEGTLDPGDSLPEIVVTGVVAGDASEDPEGITNFADVFRGETYDPNLTNNHSEATVYVTHSADLELVKLVNGVDTASLDAGATATYTIDVTNNGPSQAEGPITVVDELPDGVAFVSFGTTDPAWDCDTSALPEITCEIDDPLGASGSLPEIQIVVTVEGDAPLAPPGLENTATVSSPTHDPDPSNNTDEAFVEVARYLADLTISKSHTGDFAVGSSGTYTITVTNLGPSASEPGSNLVTALDSMPVGLRITSVDAGSGWDCTWDWWFFVCEYSDPIPPLTSAPDITVTVDVEPGAFPSVTNTADVLPGETFDPDLDNNTAEDPTTVVELADLTIEKSTDDTFYAGQTGEFDLVVTNLGPSASVGGASEPIRVLDTVPSGFTLMGALGGAGWDCSASVHPTVDCTYEGSLAASDSLDPITVAVQVADDADGDSITNTAEVVPGETPDPDPSNNSDDETVTVLASADLAIEKTSGGSFVVGEQGTYTFAVENLGPSTASQLIRIDDVFPVGLTPVSYSSIDPWTCFNNGPVTPSGQPVRCQLAQDFVNGRLSFLTITVDVGASVDSTITNTAVVSSTGGTHDPDTSNNTDSVTDDTTLSSDLAITKLADGVETTDAYSGENVTFTLTVTNNGPSVNPGPITVVDTIPGGLTFEDFGTTDLDWTCDDSADPVITCTYSAGDLDPGDSLPVIEIVVTVDGDATEGSPGLDNVATVSSATYDPDTSNNTDHAFVEVTHSSDLAIVKTVSDPDIYSGEQTTFTLTVTNNGPSVNPGPITVVDTLPDGLSFTDLGTTDGSWNCETATAPVISCVTPGPLAVGASLDAANAIEIGVTADGDADEGVPLTNWAEVSSDTYDPEPSNNEDYADVEVTHAADLALVKTADDADLYSGETATFRLDVTNNGPSASVGDASEPINVTDTLPEGLIWPVTVDGGVDWGCAPPSGDDATGWTVNCDWEGTLASGDSLPQIVVTAVVAGDADDQNPLVNTAVVTPGVTEDLVPSNNTDTADVNVTHSSDLAITKLADGVETTDAYSGENVTFTLTVTNNGPSVNPGPITVVDTIPGGLTFEDFGTTDLDWTCDDSADPVITCTYSAGDLDPGDSLPVIEIVVTVDGDATEGSPGLDNVATVSSATYDPDTSNNTDHAFVEVTHSSDLAIVKTVSDPDIYSGEQTTFTLTVTNNGPSVNPGPITVVDTLPDGLSFTDLGTTNLTLWTCDVTGLPAISCVTPGPLAVGASLDGANSIEIVVTADGDADEGVPLTNWAEVSSDTYDPEPSNNEDYADVEVTHSADLALVKTVDDDTLYSGEAATFRLNVENLGPSASVGTPGDPITVMDDLPIGLIAPVNASGVDWDCAAATGDDLTGWSVSCTWEGTLNPGDSLPEIVVTALVAGDASEDPLGLLNESVVVPGETEDLVPSNNFDDATIYVTHSSDLAITKTVSDPDIYSGEQTTFTLTVTNNGPSVNPGPITVVDTLPDGLSFTDLGTTNLTLWTCDVTGLPAISCVTPGPLGVGDSLPVIEIVVTADGDADEGVPLTNWAEVSSDTYDPEPSNNEDYADVEVTHSSDLAIVKTVSDPDIYSGEQTTFTLTVTNNGPSVNPGPITVVDTLPAGLDYVSLGATDIGLWTCDVTGLPAISCVTPGPLGVGSSLSGLDAIQIVVAADGDADEGVPLTNWAEVSSDTYDPEPSNNEDYADVVVTHAADLAIVKTVSDPDIYSGEQTTFTLTVTNNGPSVNPGPITVEDTLPDGLTFADLGTTDGSWNCETATAPVITCETPGPLGVGDSLPVIEIVVTADGDADEGVPLTNWAEVSSDTYDPEPSNNEDYADVEVTHSSDLAITKTVSDPDIYSGEQTTFTLTVTNNGPSVNPGPITVEDTLPDGLSFTDLGTTNLTLWTCDVTGLPAISCVTPGPLGVGDSLPVIEIVVTADGDADEGVPLTNWAEVSSDTYDPEPSNNEDFADVEVTHSSDLAITKTVSDDEIYSGEQTTFTLTVTNNGPSVNPGPITVVDTLPTGLDYVSLGTTDIGLWTCDITGLPAISCVTPGPLGVGASLSGTDAIQIVVEAAGDATEGAPGLENTATVSSPTYDPNTTNNTDTESVIVTHSSDLAMVKTVSDDEIYSGEQTTFTLTVTNNGPSVNPGPITVVDTLPTGLDYVSLGTTDIGLWTCDITGLPAISCVTPGPLGVGASLSGTDAIQIVVEAAGDATEGAPGLENTATVSSPTYDPNTTNNTDTESVIVTHSSDLSIVKLVDGVESVDLYSGDTGTFTLAVTNNGPSDNPGPITVVDTLPAGLTFESFGTTDTSVWTCDASGEPTITCETTDDLPAGFTFVNIEIEFSVDGNATEGAPGLENSATVSSPTYDPNPLNNTDEAYVVVTHSSDLAITKLADGVETTDAYSGEDVTFTLAVDNLGPSINPGPITVVDTIPAGLTFVDFGTTDTGVWTCDDSALPVVTCTTPGPLGVGASLVNIEIVANVDGNATEGVPGLENTATVSSPTYDPNPLNNTDEAYVVVSHSADLEIIKTHTAPSFIVGETGTYLIGVTNNGPSVSVGTTGDPITVTDSLPAGLTPTAVDGGGDWTCGFVGQAVTCTYEGSIPVGATLTAISVTVDVGVAAEGGVVNTAVVIPGETHDPDLDNNESDDPTDITPAADLTITKTAVGTFTAGQSATFTIEVTNLGLSESVGTMVDPIAVSDTLPVGLTPTFVDGGPDWLCGWIDQDVDCFYRSPIPAGQAAPLITITVTVAPGTSGQSFTNWADVEPGETYDPNPANNEDFADVTVSPSSDLAIVKTVDDADLYSGDTATFRLDVANNGPSDNPGPITVVDTLPAGLVASSATASGTGWVCDVATSPTITCMTAGPLADGASAPQITVTATVAGNAAEGAPGLRNTATVSSPTFDPDPGNNTDTADVFVTHAADLALTKATDQEQLDAGQTATFRIDVTNNGPSPSVGTTTEPIRVVDTLPTGLVAPITATGAQWACTITAPTITCDWQGSVASGADLPQITVTALVDGGAPEGVPLTNEAEVFPGVTEDLVPANNADSASVEVTHVADLVISKSHAADSFFVGFTGTYVIGVANDGPSPSVGTTTDPITVTDTLPTGLTPISFDTTGWDCGIVGQTVTCDYVGSLAAGASAPPISITVEVGVAAEGGVINTATVTPGETEDPNLDNNTAEDPTDITPSADMSIVKTSGPAFVVDHDATYTFTVHNDGPSAASQPITITDTLVTGLTYVGAESDDAWACEAVGQDVTCVLAESFVADRTSEVTITVAVGVEIDPEVMNSATVESPTFDPEPSNNTSGTEDPSTPTVDLVLDKSHTGNFLVGTPGTYTIGVANNGPSISVGEIEVVDQIPAGLTPTAAGGTGWDCVIDGQLVTCAVTDTVGPGESFALLTITVDVLPEAYPEVVNSATVYAPPGINEDIIWNNTDEDPTVVGPLSDLAITKSHTGEPAIGEPFTWVLAVSNLGPTPTPGSVVVTDTLPDHFEVTSVSGAGWECALDGQDLECALADGMAVSDAAPIEVVVVPQPGSEGTSTNTAQVEGPAVDPNPANNTDSDSVDVTATVDLSLTKEVIGRVISGTPATWRLTVTNHGPSAATDVVLTDHLPEGLVYQGFSGEGWSCTAAGQTVTCTLAGSIEVGTSSVLELVTLVTAPAGDAVANNASVVATGIDPNEHDNETSTSPTVVEEPSKPDDGDGGGTDGTDGGARSGTGTLPRTGQEVAPTIWLALLLVLAGSALVTLTSRRRRRSTRTRRS